MAEKQLYDPAEDERMQHPFVDADEMRERELSDGTRIPYRYVHGGFEGTNIKFLFCFPEKQRYEGRFIQYLSPFPGPDEEVASLDKTGEDDRIAFALTHGAYSVESNMGSAAAFGPAPDPTMVWKSSAAVAEFSRVKAAEIYGGGRPFGYVHGGSGGGYKTMACVENTAVWDGALPYVIGSPASLPNTITLHVQGQRTLRNAFGKIVDALDAGGSGDMYEGLTEDERAMLKEITAMGFPPRSWFIEALGQFDDGALPVLTPGVKMADPTFFQEFWTVPGYAGADPTSNACRDRLQFEGVVKSVHMPGDEKGAETAYNGVDDAWKKMLADGGGSWIELEEVPQGDDLYLKGVNISFLTGDAQEYTLLLDRIEENCLVIGMCYGMEDLAGALSKVKPGDRVSLDNSDYIAIQHYYRHQVPPDKSFHVWDQFRKEDGTPAIPQRANFMGYGFTGTGTVQDGNIQCKTIVMCSLMDESSCPWCGMWYRDKVVEAKGSDADVRLYYNDHCIHGDYDNWGSNRITTYLGALRQGLLDLIAWVEKGIEPLPSTVCSLEDGQVIVPETAAERKGMQPVPILLANGGACARVKVGEEVTFMVEAVVPEGAGEIVAVYGDYEDHGVLSAKDAFCDALPFERKDCGGLRGAAATFRHAYDKPGTYFASALVASSRDAEDKDAFTRVKNLARARVIVE